MHGDFHEILEDIFNWLSKVDNFKSVTYKDLDRADVRDGCVLSGHLGVIMVDTLEHRAHGRRRRDRHQEIESANGLERLAGINNLGLILLILRRGRKD